MCSDSTYLCEVGSLFNVYSRTCMPIFIENLKLYLTDTEQKISCHVFLRHGVYCLTHIVYLICAVNNDVSESTGKLKTTTVQLVQAIVTDSQ